MAFSLLQDYLVLELRLPGYQYFTAVFSIFQIDKHLIEIMLISCLLHFDSGQGIQTVQILHLNFWDLSSTFLLELPLFLNFIQFEHNFVMFDDHIL